MPARAAVPRSTFAFRVTPGAAATEGGAVIATQRILVVDDEEKMRRVLAMALQALGYEVAVAGDGNQALSQFDDAPFDLVLTDLRMPGLDGMGLLRGLRERGEEVPVIVLTAHGSVESAVEAMKLGAVDYILRPFEMETVELAVTRALAVGAVQRENRYLRDEVAKGWGEFVGRSPNMQALYDLIRQVAPSRSSVLVVGETGTGKELVARALHQASGRDGLFVAVNCAAIPHELLESEMFGHQKGAFTGASRDKMGKFELASGGTLFLDEITEMPLALQAKLLRVLQENSVERLGAHRAIPVDLRVVAATNREPQAAIESKHLRSDLYYRLNVVRIDLPPLKERTGDIPLLAEHFLHGHCHDLGREPPRLSEQVVAALEAYSWPGNVRELENLMERIAVLCRGDTLVPAQLPPEIAGAKTAPASPPTHDDSVSGSLAMPARIESLERKLIAQALRQAGDNKSAAARLLEISERSLWYKIKKYGL
jgi:two-component system response regulator AtoC